MVKVSVKIGKTLVEYDAKDVQEAHRFSSIYGNLPDQCSVCSGKNLYLYHKSPKGNDYYGIKCSCGAEQNFHQLKTGGFFIKPEDKFTKWDGDAGA